MTTRAATVSSHRRAHRWSVLAVVLTTVAAALVAACGVDVDSAPRPVRTEASTTTTSAAPASGRAEVVLYYVREGVLLPVIDELPDRGLNSTLSALLQPPSDSVAMVGLGTSIPSGTELLGVEREAGVLRIDLSDAFDNVVGRSRQQAIGQLVLTSTQVSDVRNVSFEVEGEQITVLSPSRGDRTEVNACDFQSLLATVEDASAAALPFASFEVLSERRRELDDECR